MRESLVPRRSLLLSAAGMAGVAVAGAASGPASAVRGETGGRRPLWKVADERGVAFGSSIATWQFDDDYPALHAREAKLLFTEDDLLWYRLKPTPDAPLDFSYADRIIGFAEANRMRVFGAHLVWDQGFGAGWPDDHLWSLTRAEARELLFGTLAATVRRYRGRVDAWSVANEVTGPEGVRGLRTDVPWWETIGPSYVAEAFHHAHAADPRAVLVINEFGFETVNEWGDEPEARRRATLQAVDTLLRDGVPVHALGVRPTCSPTGSPTGSTRAPTAAGSTGSPTVASTSSSPNWTCWTTGCRPTRDRATPLSPRSTGAIWTSPSPTGRSRPS